MNTIAIMQPYFIPYTGYFRLIDQADTFVIFDCVQYQRRGWIHRNKLHNHQGTLQWLTLPIKKQSQSTLIKDIKFTNNAQSEWNLRLQRFSHLTTTPPHPLWERVLTLEDNPLAYLEVTLQSVSCFLDLSTHWIRSSDLNVPQSLQGEQRIIEIVRRLQGTRYINAPGGRHLYNPSAFSENDIELSFLPFFEGSMTSILERILTEDKDVIINDIKTY